ncbi:peptidylprolyl isomerase [Aurantibacter sp.]|uniref:peptidylprolyl isomerase n=1 Tax=Aurantibacter sp. TaxID=2807103 RepID=UPI0035C7ACEC
MKNFYITLFLIFGTAYFVNAQQDVLFTINNKPILSKEFKRVYNKNLDLVQDNSQKNIDNYLDLFINYKLKLEDAYDKGLDKKQSYRNELEGYKKQLTQKYLNDNKVTDQLIIEAYERLKTEVNANHVLIKLDENASELEQTKALEEINKIRLRVIEEGFDAVQKQSHNGKTIFAENLGYFTAFKMVYNFETVAYNTKVGDVSEPFRTRFGYHIVIVNDIRKNRGEVTVAHIMLETDKEQLINQLYKRLEQNEDFQALAKQYSVDKSSSSKGGMLPAFSGGQLSSTLFEDKAFGLKEISSYTKPFKTKFGWHIIKLYSKKDLPEFNTYKLDLAQKVKRDSRSQVLNNKRVEDLLTRYDITYNQPLLKDFEAGLNNSVFKGLWTIPDNLNTDKPFLAINKQILVYKDFANFLHKIQRRTQPKRSFKELLEKVYKDFVDVNVLRYQENHLEDENEEYAQILNEYKEGLLLFELMGNQIWNSSENDSLALKEYYNLNKTNYTFPKRIEATIASSANKKQAKKVYKLLVSGKTKEEIESLFNTKNQVNVTFNSGNYELDDPALPSKLKIEKGIFKVQKNNKSYVVVQIDSILPEGQKSYYQARGSVMSDFQDQKEIKWISELKAKYPVVINKSNLNALKAELKN